MLTVQKLRALDKKQQEAAEGKYIKLTQSL
jgi:hypothetical protein